MLIEHEALLQEERKRFRTARIKQARHLANVAAKRIRDRVRFTRDTLQKEAEDEVFRQLVARQMALIELAAERVEATYEHEVGRAFDEANVVSIDQESAKTAKEAEAKQNELQAAKRFLEAKAHLDAARVDACKETIYRRLAKKSALETEMERTKAILSRPLPPKSEVEKVSAELEETKRRPFRVLESNVYQTTRYHLGAEDEDLVKHADEPVVRPVNKKQTSVGKIKVTSSYHDDSDDDSVPHKKVPQPAKKEPRHLMLPLVEKPATLDQAKSLAMPLDVDEEKEAASKKRREELEEKARLRGEAALKEERNSRHFEKLLSDLTTLQQVWRRHEVVSQPHVIGGRLYVGPDRVDAEKRAQQNRLEAAFNPLVKAAAANLPPIMENEALTLSPKSSKSESGESAVGTGSASSLSGFCWQESSVTSEEEAQERTMIGAAKSESTCSDYVAQSPGRIDEENGSDADSSATEPPPLEQQSLSPAKIEPPRPLTRGTTFSSVIETGPLPQLNLGTTTSSSETSCLSAGIISSSTLVADVEEAPKQGLTSSYEWLLEHNRVLMEKIDLHRRQIEDQRVALAKRLEELNVHVASPLRVSATLHDLQQSVSTGGSVSAPSSLARPNQQQQKTNDDDFVIAFSPSHSSSFISDTSAKRLPPFLNQSGSTDSSSLSTGPLALSNSDSSSTPLNTEPQSRPVLSTLPENDHEMSLLIEKSNSTSSSSSASVVVAPVQKISNPNTSTESSSLGSLMQDYYASRTSGSRESSKQTAPVLPALSSTPRREDLASTLSARGAQRTSIPIEQQISPPAFRSLLLEPDNNPEDFDDFDLPPPSLVGDDSFLNQLPSD